jgi:hypothetical protein
LRIETVATIVQAPAERVFGFISTIDNLPRWAIEFCRGLERVGDRHYVETPEGRVVFDVRSDARTGVVDFVGGPEGQAPSTWPCRVVPLAETESVVLFTAMQEPHVPDRTFEGQLASLRREMEQLKRCVA